MIDFKVDKYGEPIFENGDLVPVLDNNSMAAQQIYIVLQSIQGEYDLDSNLGLIQDNLYGKHVTFDYLRQDIIDAVEDQCTLVSNVDEVVIDFDRSKRSLNIVVSYITIDSAQGQTNVNVMGGGDR